MNSAILFVVIMIAGLCQAGRFSFGRCPNVGVVDIDVDKLIGVWFEHSRYKRGPDNKCTELEFALTQNNVINIDKSFIKDDTQYFFYGNATMNPTGGDVCKEITIRIPGLSENTPYKVLWLDENFTILWSCNKFGPFANSQLLSILTRDRYPTKEVIDEAHAVLKDNNLSTSLTYIDHSECDFYNDYNIDD